MISSKIFDQIPPFNFLSISQREEMLLRAKPITLNDGEMICCEDDLEYDHMYLIIEGGITVYNEKGATQAIQHHSSPTYFGEISLFFDQPRGDTKKPPPFYGMYGYRSQINEHRKERSSACHRFGKRQMRGGTGNVQGITTRGHQA